VKEIQERRKQMLFLKRLEIDGSIVMISEQDKDLFQQYMTREEAQSLE
jgi:predicted RNA polymerase sigma factor